MGVTSALPASGSSSLTATPRPWRRRRSSPGCARPACPKNERDGALRERLALAFEEAADGGIGRIGRVLRQEVAAIDRVPAHIVGVVAPHLQHVVAAALPARRPPQDEQ